MLSARTPRFSGMSQFSVRAGSRRTPSGLGTAALAALGLAAAALPQAAHAQLTPYTTRASFDTAFPGLPEETFEEAHISDSFATFPSPLDSDTSNAVFPQGLTQPGLRITDTGPRSGAADALLAARAGAFGNPSKAVYDNSFGDELFLTFDNGGTQAVGLDLLSFTIPPSSTPVTETATVFSGATMLGFYGPMVSPSGTFFGVSSAGARITGLSITGDNKHARGVDNIAFATPEPSSAADFAVAGLGAAGLILRARKRRPVA